MNLKDIFVYKKHEKENKSIYLDLALKNMAQQRIN